MKGEILKTFIEKVWNEGNVDAIPEFIAERYKIIHDPGDPWDGQELDLEGFQERVVQSRAPLPNQRFDIQELYEADFSVCITWYWSGNHQGELAGYPPTGEKLYMSGATVYYFQNDKIAGHWQITDRLGVFQQLQANQKRQLERSTT